MRIALLAALLALLPGVSRAADPTHPAPERLKKLTAVYVDGLFRARLGEGEGACRAIARGDEYAVGDLVEPVRVDPNNGFLFLATRQRKGLHCKQSVVRDMTGSCGSA